MENADDNLSPEQLQAYFDRIGYTGECCPTVDVLKAVHLLHAQSIPFENFDALLRRDVRIDTNSLFEKLVKSGRGGWCYEQNGLLREVYRAIGFEVTDLCGRVVVRTGLPGRDEDLIAGTHRFMRVRVNSCSEDWIADVGLGVHTLDTPIRLVEDLVQHTAMGTYSIVKLSATDKRPVDVYVLRRHYTPEVIADRPFSSCSQQQE